MEQEFSLLLLLLHLLVIYGRNKLLLTNELLIVVNDIDNNIDNDNDSYIICDVTALAKNSKVSRGIFRDYAHDN